MVGLRIFQKQGGHGTSKSSLTGCCSSTCLCCVSWKLSVLFGGQADPRLAEADSHLFKQASETVPITSAPCLALQPQVLKLSFRLKSLKKTPKTNGIEADAELVSCTALFSKEHVLHHLGEPFARPVPHSLHRFPPGVL